MIVIGEAAERATSAPAASELIVTAVTIVLKVAAVTMMMELESSNNAAMCHLVMEKCSEKCVMSEEGAFFPVEKLEGIAYSSGCVSFF